MTFLPSSAYPQLPKIADKAYNAFLTRFNCPPRWLAVAPGRVNLIGEHIDYNDGFVLPVAIDRYTALAAGPAIDSTIHIESLDANEIIKSTSFDCHSHPAWAAYVLGPLLLCQQHGMEVEPFCAIIASDVPRGAGLSSSAALEVASATLAETISGQSLDPIEKARLCQKAEHDYANVPCGIMDQAASVAAKKDSALLLDCQAETWTSIPFGQSDVQLLIANTNVTHSLGDGQYAARRNECNEALLTLGKTSYRNVTPADIHSASLESILYKRATHVVSEITRTCEAAVALEQADWARFGELMNQSHISLSEDYQVSCKELDIMARIAWDLGPKEGLFGSRMTGGGFGGCTVSLVQSTASLDIANHMRQRYRRETGIESEIFIATPSEGTMGFTCHPSRKS